MGVLEQLQEKCAIVCTEYNNAISMKLKYENENNALRNEITNIKSKLTEQGSIGMKQDTIAQVNQEINDMKVNLKEMQNKLNSLIGQKADVQVRLDDIAKELAQKTKIFDSLNDDILQNDETISKMSSEKRLANDKVSKSNEELQSGESKLNFLVDTKKKLEEIYDDMQMTTESEKKRKIELETARRSLEMDLKSTQLNLHNLNREKLDMEQVIHKMEVEMKECKERHEKEEFLICRNQKIIRELQIKEEKIESEIDLEKQAKLQAEMQRSDLARESEKLTDHLDEANNNTNAQMEINSKLEAKAQEIRKDKEELNISWEATLQKLRKKHQE